MDSLIEILVFDADPESTLACNLETNRAGPRVGGALEQCVHRAFDRSLRTIGNSVLEQVIVITVPYYY